MAALALVRSVAHEKIALCTHGDVIPEILVALGHGTATIRTGGSAVRRLV